MKCVGYYVKFQFLAFPHRPARAITCHLRPIFHFHLLYASTLGRRRLRHVLCVRNREGRDYAFCELFGDFARLILKIIETDRSFSKDHVLCTLSYWRIVEARFQGIQTPEIRGQTFHGAQH